MKTIIRKIAIGLVVFSIPTSVFADENGLYGTSHPKDAVYIRWLGHNAVTPTIFNHTFPIATTSDRAYAVISNAALTGAEAGAFYTVIDGNEDLPRFIKEPDRTDKSKVQLILLNATEIPVRLTLVGTDKVIISATGMDEANARAVNPVSAEVAVVSIETKDVLGTFNLSLRRGQNMTIAVTDAGVELIENSFGSVITTATEVE